MNRAFVKYLSTVILLVVISGCAPHPYERLALVLPNKDSSFHIKETEQLQDCIFEKHIPKEYQLERNGYVLEIATMSGFEGHMPRLYFHATTSTGIPLAVSGERVISASYQPWQYENYRYQWVAVGKSEVQLKLNFKDTDGDEVGEENILVTIESCKAVEIDAL